MRVVANDVVFVSKVSNTWKNGDVSYRAQVTNGEGEPVKIYIAKEIYENVVVLVKRYDIELEITSGSKGTYIDLVTISEV